MKYLLMCCHEEKKWDSMSNSECDAVMEETMAYVEALKKSGQLLAVEQLDPVKTAISVRVRSGKLYVTDGPYAETKEQLGGFFLISARDLNEAIQVASKFPSVRFGTMEVRPVRRFPAATALRRGRDAMNHFWLLLYCRTLISAGRRFQTEEVPMLPFHLALVLFALLTSPAAAEEKSACSLLTSSDIEVCRWRESEREPADSF